MRPASLNAAANHSPAKASPTILRTPYCFASAAYSAVSCQGRGRLHRAGKVTDEALLLHMSNGKREGVMPSGAGVNKGMIIHAVTRRQFKRSPIIHTGVDYGVIKQRSEIASNCACHSDAAASGSSRSAA